MELTDNATVDKILQVIAADYIMYPCYDLLRSLLEKYPNFKNKIIEGYNEGKIWSFSDDYSPIGSSLWDVIVNSPNSNVKNLLYSGRNIGNCTGTAYNLYIILEELQTKNYLAGGTLPILRGTKNSEDGRHTWTIVINNGEVFCIDTSLMIIIDYNFIKDLGYVFENGFGYAKELLEKYIDDLFNKKNLNG